MRKYLGMTALILGFSALPLALHAQDEGEGEEDTMVTLPDEAAEEAHENATFGLETANEARADGRAFGESQAEEAQETGSEAREDGRAFGESQAEEARETGSDVGSDIADDARGDAGSAGDNGRDNIPEDPGSQRP